MDSEKPYIETLLDYLARYKGETIARQEIADHLSSIYEILGSKRIASGILNFKRLHLIDDIGSNHYKLNHDLIRSFKQDFDDGKINIWWSKNGQKKQPCGLIPVKTHSPEPIEPTNSPTIKTEFTGISDRMKASRQIPLRAVVSAISGPWTNEILLDTAKEKGFDFIDIKACANLRVHKKECFDIHGVIEKKLYYSPNDKFFKRFAFEKEYYKQLLPDLSSQIDKAFESKNAGQIANFDDMPFEQNTKQRIVKRKCSRPSTCIHAVLAGYNKDLTGRDILSILSNNGIEISFSSWSHYFKRHSDLFTITGKRGRANTVKANDLFFKNNFRIIDELIKIFPNRAEQIRKSFAKHGCYDKDYEPAAQETKSAIDELTIEPAAQDEQTQDENYSMVDAANVGASILNYIVSLKRQIKDLKQNDPTELATTRAKYEDAKQKIIGLQNENQNLTSQIDKLKTISNQNNETIIDLNHKVSVLKNRIELSKDQNKMIPSSFKLGEVARLTSVIKGKV